MSKKALYIVEGKRTEPRFLRKMLSGHIDPENIYSYGTNIHVLISGFFDTGSLDEDLDLIGYLRSRECDDAEREKLERRYTDVYLVFDLDPQEPSMLKNSGKLRDMLRYFDDSTDNGKLYLNYPMHESYRHLASMDDPDFLTRRVSLTDLKGYKSIVSSECCESLRDPNRCDVAMFKALAVIHLRKANYLMTGTDALPAVDEYLSWNGTEIYDIEIASIESDGAVIVLNTSLFNIIDYRPGDILGRQPR